MINKKIYIVILIFMAIMLMGCSVSEDNVATISPTPQNTTSKKIEFVDDPQLKTTEVTFIFSRYMMVEKSEDLEKNATTIVKATMLKKEKHPTVDLNTLTDIRIDEVIKGGDDISVGDEVVLIEQYGELQHPQDENVVQVIASMDTLPLKEGHQYLLFLDKSSSNGSYSDYSLALGWQGKYAINDKVLNNDIKELNTDDVEWTAPELKEKYNTKALSDFPFAVDVIEKYIKGNVE
jgi:hypothetical protein